jgi:hypothetical protein
MLRHIMGVFLTMPAFGSLAPGLSQQREHRAAARLRRLNELAQLSSRSSAQQREHDGLMSRGETYNADNHSATHKRFKADHNHCFVTLARLANPEAPVFYLDGPDGASTAALRRSGFGTEQLFTASLFESTRDALAAPPHALRHATLGRAEEELARPHLSSTPFAAYYLDLCSGQPAPLVAMVEAIFHPRRRRIGASRVAIGFTLTRAEPSARSLGDRELAVLRAIATGCRALGYAPPVHVADEPALYGLPTSLSKEEGGTLTTWVWCARDVADLDIRCFGRTARVHAPISIAQATRAPMHAGCGTAWTCGGRAQLREVEYDDHM